MIKNWTFGRKVAFGFLVSSLFLVIIGFVGYRSVSSLVDTSYSVTQMYKVIEDQSNFMSHLKDAETGQRGYLLTGEAAYLTPYTMGIEEAPKVLNELRRQVGENPERQRLIDQMETLMTTKFEELNRTIVAKKNGHSEEALKIVMSNEGKTTMDNIRKVSDQLEKEERDLLQKQGAESELTANATKVTIVVSTLICLLFVSVTAYFITRSLETQLGAAVSHVQSSSTELQAASTQQATSAKEQSTAMNEISTTISEMGVTSRQIAESAQRVAQIAEQTAVSARAGVTTVDKGQEAISGIRRQIDLVVNHMLDLGRKSQEIGAVLDIVSELAEQTNILAINATIEASGAGEGGKRFSVVAEEIRKLADRVANSTKGIRTQVDDVRGAVNTTVMATESGAKAVDAGARQFTEVAVAFKQIAGLVGTTTEAAREIELSTKQQATAAEQVRIAVTDVVQVTKETETSSSQTMQTASQLAGLSHNLRRLIQPQAA